jgi:oxygen-dependent protoporphyrinogen oxidase
MSRTIILGAGIAGLTAAFRRGRGETVILEAAPRAGGSIRTIREDGFVLEGGPNTLRTTEAAERLVTDLGLRAEVVPADPKAPRWIVRGGVPRAVVPGPGALFNRVFTLSGKLRLLKEPFVAQRPASLDDESVDSFFRRRFGEEAARYGAGPMVSGVYAGDPETLSIRSAFPRLWLAEERSGSVTKDFLRKKERTDGTKRPARARTLNFRTGLSALVDTLVERFPSLGVFLEMNAAAVAIEGPRVPALPGQRWTVRTADGRSFDADVLVSTLPAPALSKLLGDRLPTSRTLLSSVPSSPVTVVILAFKAPSAGDAPHGFGALIPRGEGFRALGVLYPSSLFRGRTPDGFVLTTSFLGGALDRALVGAPDAELLAMASGEVARLFPRLGPHVGSWIVRWPEAIVQLPIGHHGTLAALDSDLAELDRAAGERGTLVVTGGFRDGIALGERIARGEAIGRSLA